MTLVISPAGDDVRLCDWRAAGLVGRFEALGRGLSWGTTTDRLSMFGSVGNDVGDFVEALESASKDKQITSVDLHGVDVICATGLRALAVWHRRAGDVTLDAADDLTSLVAGLFGRTRQLVV